MKIAIGAAVSAALLLAACSHATPSGEANNSSVPASSTGASSSSSVHRVDLSRYVFSRAQITGTWHDTQNPTDPIKAGPVTTAAEDATPEGLPVVSDASVGKTKVVYTVTWDTDVTPAKVSSVAAAIKHAVLAKHTSGPVVVKTETVNRYEVHWDIDANGGSISDMEEAVVKVLPNYPSAQENGAGDGIIVDWNGPQMSVASLANMDRDIAAALKVPVQSVVPEPGLG